VLYVRKAKKKWLMQILRLASNFVIFAQATLKGWFFLKQLGLHIGCEHVRMAYILIFLIFQNEFKIHFK
jgi:hypothetical protein